VLQLFHQVANFAASHRIQARHGFVKKCDFGIVQDGLRNA
jgi:hypothetical protein